MGSSSVAFRLFSVALGFPLGALGSERPWLVLLFVEVCVCCSCRINSMFRVIPFYSPLVERWQRRADPRRHLEARRFRMVPQPEEQPVSPSSPMRRPVVSKLVSADSRAVSDRTSTHNLLLISGFIVPESILRLLLLSLHNPQLFFQLFRLILALDGFGLGILKG